MLHHVTLHHIGCVHVCYTALHYIICTTIYMYHITHYSMLHHITACYTTLHHITSHYIILHHITSWSQLYPALPQSSPWRCADSVPTHWAPSNWTPTEHHQQTTMNTWPGRQMNTSDNSANQDKFNLVYESTSLPQTLSVQKLQTHVHSNCATAVTLEQCNN